MKLRLIFALAATLAFGALSASDLTLTFTTTAKGLGGGGGTEVHSYSQGFFLNRNVEQKRDSLVDFQQGISYSIDHKKKTIQMMRMADALAALEGLNQAQPEGIGAFMGKMFGDPNDIKVEKMEKEKILDRDCQRYQITVGKLVYSISTDPTLKLPMTEASYARMIQTQAAAFAKAGPMGASFKHLYEELAKIKGVPLKTQMKGFMGMSSSSEATRIDQAPIPASLFTLPADYKLEDMGKKLREEMKAK